MCFKEVDPMNKNEMIAELEHAKKVHIEQMQKITSLLKGEAVPNPTPVAKTECAYGIWFYGNKEKIIRILGAQLYERIDKLHEAWHHGYVKIYDLFFREKKTGLFSKILGTDKPSSLDLDKGQLYYTELYEITKNLLAANDSAIRRASALNESKFHD